MVWRRAVYVNPLRRNEVVGETILQGLVIERRAWVKHLLYCREFSCERMCKPVSVRLETARGIMTSVSVDKTHPLAGLNAFSLI